MSGTVKLLPRAARRVVAALHSRSTSLLSLVQCVSWLAWLGSAAVGFALQAAFFCCWPYEIRRYWSIDACTYPGIVLLTAAAVLLYTAQCTMFSSSNTLQNRVRTMICAYVNTRVYTTPKYSYISYYFYRTDDCRFVLDYISYIQRVWIGVGYDGVEIYHFRRMCTCSTR